MVAGLAGALSVVSTAFGIFGTLAQAKATKKAEKARQRQMELEATRARREQVRRAQVARAQATANAENQGAGESSALEGGLAQVTNAAGRNILAINQDEQIGNQIFKANRQYAKAGTISAIGQGLAGLAGAFTSNTSTITRLGYSGFSLPNFGKQVFGGYA